MENKQELPKMTIEQRNTIVNPIIGLEIIDSDTNELMRFDGIEFVRINNHKQEAIKKAYGEYYDICKPDENGWSDGSYNDCEHNFKEVQYLNFDTSNDWRPIELKGIETNNGWISVNDRLPENDYDVLFISNNEIFTGVYENNGFICLNYYYSIIEVTHWQPIQFPPKPIY